MKRNKVTEVPMIRVRQDKHAWRAQVSFQGETLETGRYPDPETARYQGFVLAEMIKQKKGKSR